MHALDQNEKLLQKAWSLFSDQNPIKIFPLPQGHKNDSYVITLPDQKKFVLKKYASDFLSDEAVESICSNVSKLKQKRQPVVEFIQGKNKLYTQLVFESQEKYQFTVTRYEEYFTIDDELIEKQLLTNIVLSMRSLHNALIKIEPQQILSVFNPEEKLKLLTSKSSLTYIKEYFKEEKKEDQSFINFYQETAKTLSQYFSKNTQWNKYTQLIHGDFNLSNFSVEDYEIKTIFDFDDMTVAPVTWEIGCCLVHLDIGSIKTEDLISLFCKTYFSKQKVTQKQIQDIIMFMQYRSFYRMARWLTFYRFYGRPDKHYTYYLEKLKKYQELETKNIYDSNRKQKTHE